MCGQGAGQSTIPIQVKISSLNDQNSAYIDLFTVIFCCLVSHNKYSDIYFDQNRFKFNFISVI